MAIGLLYYIPVISITDTKFDSSKISIYNHAKPFQCIYQKFSVADKAHNEVSVWFMTSWYMNKWSIKSYISPLWLRQNAKEDNSK